jgi:hypothetical protein
VFEHGNYVGHPVDGVTHPYRFGAFLLGNVTAAELGLVIAPLYGFGAPLVRELGRRGGGWPPAWRLSEPARRPSRRDLGCGASAG